MKVFIIITTSTEGLWKENTSTWSSMEVAGDQDKIDAFELRRKKVDQDKMVLLSCQHEPQTALRENELLEEVQEETTERVLEVIRLHPDAETYIAAHSDSVDWGQVEQEVDSHQEFPHAAGDDLYDKIDTLTTKPTEESFESAEAVVKKKDR